MLAQLADRLILKPSTDPIATTGKVRRMVSMGTEQIEVWTERVGTASPADRQRVDLFVLKFPGTAGRAERATGHPADCWSDCQTELWTVNPLGYGGSSGRASLPLLAPATRAVYEELAQHAHGRPILVAGNSLGSLSALYVAANFAVDGVLLRNPPPLRQLIIGRHAWWTAGLGAWLLARQVPDQLCGVRNAAAAHAPAVFVMSGRDRLVPPRYQRLIHARYAGPYRLLELPQADHATPLDDHQLRQYAQLLYWLREQAIKRHRERQDRFVV
jgi:hypothetical protein